MELSLHVTDRQGQTPPREVPLTLGSEGITIGRALTNDLCLDDPERVVSGSHARIELRDGGVWITDTSRNGTYLNNAVDPIPSHQCVALYDGDRLGIGPYDVVVGFGSEPGLKADDISGHIDEVGYDDLGDLGSAGSSADILDYIGSGGGGGDLLPDLPPETNLPGNLFGDASSLDDRLSGPAPEAPPRGAPHRHTPVEHVFYRPSDHQEVPEDYDLLNDLRVAPSPEEGPADQPHATQVPPDFSKQAENEGVPVAPPPSALGPETERIDLFAETPEGSAPPLSRPEPAVSHAEPRPSAGGPELAAFLAGLGMEPGTQVQDPEAFMRLSGELLHALVAGLVQTMMGRAEFKDVFDLGVTIIRADRNNPFKFSANTADLVNRLLLQPTPGYLHAVTAAREAFDDIQAHEMAMTAGLRAAMRALFERFEPSKLEQGLGQGSGLDHLLSSARKAKCWDLFTQEYDRVATDAAEDFKQLFAGAFAKAYQEQVERLREARRSGRA